VDIGTHPTATSPARRGDRPGLQRRRFERFHASARPAGASLFALLDAIPAPLLALALTVLHAGFVLLATGESSLGGAYGRLVEWDGHWYASIVEQGYQCDFERLDEHGYYTNCGFFPGYPLLVLPLTALGMPAWLALPLVAQLCCWGFWTYTLLLLKRWGVGPAARAVTALALTLHPWAFFLQVGYSESPFLFFLAGYLFWSERPGRGSWLLAALHGVGMTGTRLVGVAVVPWPLLRRLSGPPRTWRQPLALAVTSCLGVALFYAFLGWRFGRPDLYHFVQYWCWSVRPDYLVMFRPDAYIPLYTNSILSPILIAWCAALAWRQRRLAPAGGDRNLFWAVLATAGLLLYLVEAAMINRQLCSLPRISYPSVVLLALASALQARHLPRRSLSLRQRLALVVVLAGVVLACLVLQVHLVLRFINHFWVA
jgi:hypothetical protein